MNPKVFISHASEDKDRFVLEFAQKLFSRGVEAWIDKWEMFPGDSLVDKIFEEGLKEAQAVIIVVSQYSIIKPWVREEINASFVKRVTGKCKLIPIVLDDANVPECLRSTLWEPINDLNDYGESLDRIVNSIFGYIEKPKLERSPRYLSTIIDKYASINKIDSIVFSEICKFAIEQNTSNQISPSQLYEYVKTYDINETAFNESIDILDRKGFIEGVRVISGAIPVFNISTFGMDHYIRANIKNFDSITEKVCVYIMNSEGNNYEIAEKLNIPVVIVSHVYNLLKQKRLIKFQISISGHIWVNDISPELRRIVEQR